MRKIGPSLAARLIDGGQNEAVLGLEPELVGDERDHVTGVGGLENRLRTTVVRPGLPTGSAAWSGGLACGGFGSAAWRSTRPRSAHDG
jgi:hypothetical protein